MTFMQPTPIVWMRIECVVCHPVAYARNGLAQSGTETRKRWLFVCTQRNQITTNICPSHETPATDITKYAWESLIVCSRNQHENKFASNDRADSRIPAKKKWESEKNNDAQNEREKKTNWAAAATQKWYRMSDDAQWKYMVVVASRSQTAKSIYSRCYNQCVDLAVTLRQHRHHHHHRQHKRSSWSTSVARTPCGFIRMPRRRIR